MIRRLIQLMAVLMAVMVQQHALAVIILGPEGRNTDAPTDALADSGWQYQGQWKAFLGTPISPSHFITAAHIGGSVGDEFKYQGETYTTVSQATSPDADLSIWEIDGTFPDFAPLYTNTDETGNDLVVFGRGTQRGDPIIIDAQNKGWQWGDTHRVQSWGTNTVTQIFDAGDSGGDLLEFTFDASGGDNEAHLSEGDSGGGVFIKDGDTWKLAGISVSVTGPYRSTAEGTEFNAAIFDQGGLYTENDEGTWELTTDTPADIPGSSFATRISSNTEWINSSVPEPASSVVLLISSVSLMMLRSRSTT